MGNDSFLKNTSHQRNDMFRFEIPLLTWMFHSFWRNHPILWYTYIIWISWTMLNMVSQSDSLNHQEFQQCNVWKNQPPTTCRGICSSTRFELGWTGTSSDESINRCFNRIFMEIYGFLQVNNSVMDPFPHSYYKNTPPDSPSGWYLGLTSSWVSVAMTNITEIQRWSQAGQKRSRQIIIPSPWNRRRSSRRSENFKNRLKQMTCFSGGSTDDIFYTKKTGENI